MSGKWQNWSSLGMKCWLRKGRKGALRMLKVCSFFIWKVIACLIFIYANLVILRLNKSKDNDNSISHLKKISVLHIKYPKFWISFWSLIQPLPMKVIVYQVAENKRKLVSWSGTVGDFGRQPAHQGSSSFSIGKLDPPLSAE